MCTGICHCAFSLNCCVSASWQRSKEFQAPIGPRCEMVDAQGGEGVDLLATINIKLL